MLDVRQIQVFLALCEELSFARTGERTGLSTSRVSQTIRDLEAAVGGRLFERTSRRVAITPLGALLRDELKPGYARIQRAYAVAREAATGVNGTLRLGMYAPINGGPRLMEIQDRFEADHPGATVEIVHTGFDALGALRRGDVDLLAHRLPTSDPDLVVGPVLSSEERLIVVADDHPLAEREAVGLEDLRPYALTENTSIARELVDDLVPRTAPGGETYRRIDIRGFEELTMLIAQGKVVHPSVRSFFDFFRYPGLVAVPLHGLPRSRTALVWLTGATNPRIDAFAEVASAVLGHPTA